MSINFRANEPSCVYMNNVLNEVLNGFEVDFETMLGTKRERILEIFKSLRLACDEGKPIEKQLSREDVKFVLRCSNLCLQEIDADEFETRLGESVEEAMLANEAMLLYIDNNPVRAERNI